MDAASVRESDPGFWKGCWESDQQELVRSERVQSQLQTVLLSLQQRCSDLDAENAKIRAEVRPDATTERLESEVTAAHQASQALEARQSALSLEIERHQTECQARVAQSTAQLELLAESTAARGALEEACCAAEARREQAALKARSMVMGDALHRTSEEASQLRSQLQAQEAETAELREALADSWAARADEELFPDEEPVPVESNQASASQLEDMMEQLQWLAKMQQEAAAEVHHVQKLERTEAAMQAQLRTAMDENATLRNTRMDLGHAGRAMREAIASQSERYVGRVDGLAEERKRTDNDREKLMQECAELQVRLDVLTPELVDLAGLEERHGELEAERLAVASESERLHTVNATLGVLLLGEDGVGMGGDDGVAEAVTRLLQLQRRLTDREVSHAEEKQRLADRIRSLERDNATSGMQLQEQAGATPAAAAAGGRSGQAAQKGSSSVPKPLANASSVFKGGLKSIRQATGV